MEKKLYLWMFATLASCTLLYVHTRIAPNAWTPLSLLNPARLTAAVNGAFSAEFDPTVTDRETLHREGFYIQDVRRGSGREVAARTQVHIRYSLATTDGVLLRDMRKAEPYVFTVGSGEVIRGLSMGVMGMREGGVRTLVVPPAYAYGNVSVPGVTEGGALVFTVELVSVE